MDNNYEKYREILQNSKKTYESNAKKITEMNEKMVSYKKENGWMKNDPGLKEKYAHEIEVMQAHIDRDKQIVKGDIETVIKYAKKTNESILPYIKGTDANAEVRINLILMRDKEIESELAELESEKSSIPKDIQEYTQEGRERVQKIDNKIEALKSEKNKIKNAFEMYANRASLLEEYRKNTETINTYEKNAKKLGIDLKETPAPTTPASTPATPTSTPTTPTSTPTTPTSTPTTPTSTPTTPTSTPTTPGQKKDLEIRIGKNLTVTRYTEKGYTEEEIPMEDYKDSLYRTPENIYNELCKKLKLNPEKEDKEIREISEKVNPIVWEALRTVDTEYLANYIDRLLDNDVKKSKIDIIYDENEYGNRSIFDKIKSFRFVDKALNKKEIEKIERYAHTDVERRKIARIIPKRDKKAKQLDPAKDPVKNNGRSEFIKRLESIEAIGINDPDQGKDASVIEKENRTKKQAENEKSDDYLDRF